MATTVLPHQASALTLPTSLPSYQGGDPELRGADEGMGALVSARTQLLTETKAIVKDPGLNPIGIQQRITQMAEQVLPGLHKGLEKANANRAALSAGVETLLADAQRPPTDSPVTRMDQWQAVGWIQAQSQTKQNDLLSDMLTGKNAELRDLVLGLPSFAFPFTPQTRALLVSQQLEERVDRAALDSIQNKLEQATLVADQLGLHIDALEDASDRAQLRAKGIPTKPRRSDFTTDAAKVVWIDKHGLDAWQNLRP